MNFEEYYKTMPKLANISELNIARTAWDACKNEMLKIIKSKYPNYVRDLVYEDGFDTACMSIEEEIEKL